MVDASTSANIISKYQYDEFGYCTQYNEVGYPNPFRYVGKYGVMYFGDNLYYMRARFYDPAIGRFLSEDPIWSTNLYPYADNNPVMGIDPKGTNFEIPTLLNNEIPAVFKDIKIELGNLMREIKSSATSTTATATQGATATATQGASNIVSNGTQEMNCGANSLNPVYWKYKIVEFAITKLLYGGDLNADDDYYEMARKLYKEYQSSGGDMSDLYFEYFIFTRGDYKKVTNAVKPPQKKRKTVFGVDFSKYNITINGKSL
jgi:RHS repeat-associated protein